MSQVFKKILYALKSEKKSVTIYLNLKYFIEKYILLEEFIKVYKKIYFIRRVYKSL